MVSLQPQINLSVAKQQLARRSLEIDGEGRQVDVPASVALPPRSRWTLVTFASARLDVYSDSNVPIVPAVESTIAIFAREAASPVYSIWPIE